MVLALQDYILTGEMDERALYGDITVENKTEKGVIMMKSMSDVTRF